MTREHRGAGSHEPAAKPNRETSVSLGPEPQPQQDPVGSPANCSGFIFLARTPCPGDHRNVRLKSVCPTGKTLEEGVGAQGLGEGWQLRGVMKRPAVFAATGSGDWHHILRRTGIKTKVDGSWVIFFLFNSGSCRSHHLVFIMRLQGVEIGCFKQKPTFFCRSARDLRAFRGRCWQNGAAGRAPSSHPSDLLRGAC